MTTIAYIIVILVAGSLPPVMSAFYGFNARQIHTAMSKSDWMKQPLAWRLHQFWLNFFGSAIGWLCLYAFVFSLSGQAILALTFGNTILLFVGIIGVVGYLPLTIDWISRNLNKFLGS